MTEGSKTGIMAVIAGVIALLAWMTTARNTEYAVSKGSKGKALFEKFSDPMTAASLKILRYDKPTENYVEFEVAQDRKSGVWTIPSHESYPADAAKQMSEAANLFVGLKALDVASEKRADQSLFGVVEPNKQNAEQGGEGVGMLVQMRDAKGDMLADLIIGKDNDKKQRFVRIPSEDVIYVVELDPAPLSTDFKQWIEADLLKLSSMDIENIGIRDYQIVQTNQGLGLSKNYEADLAYSTSNGQWNATRITSFESSPPTERTLGPDEQINTSKLNDMKNALDSLRIADVLKKPTGLAGDLKGNKSLLANQESLTSLGRRGFYPNPNQKDAESVDFYSKSGDLIVTLKDGVQYLLRFGNAAGAEIRESEKKDGEKEEDVVSINRFLLVTTRVDESKFPSPELEKVPESVDELKAIEALKNQPAPDANAPTIPALPAVPENNKPANEVPTNEDNTKKENAKEENSKEEGKEPNAEKETNAAAPGTELPTEKPSPVSSMRNDRVNRSETVKLVSMQEPAAPAQPKADDQKPEPAKDSEPTEEEWKERLEAAKEKITKENQRKIEQRNEKIQSAKKKVAELNGRFADWYYVISEDDYKKLRISMSDLIQPKSTTPASGSAPGSGFQGLPGGGLPGLPDR